MAKPKSSKSSSKKPTTDNALTLPDIAAVATGDPALDDRLREVSAYHESAVAAIEPLAADRRPDVVRGLRELVRAIASAIHVPKLPSKLPRALQDAYANFDGEVEVRLWRLRNVLEALTAHRAPAAEADLVEILQTHRERRVQYAMVRALLGEQFSKPDATTRGPLDPARRSSPVGLQAIVASAAKQQHDPLAAHFASLAAT